MRQPNELLHKSIFERMLLCMRTTMDINDELLKAAKAYAARRSITLKAVVEQALRDKLTGGRQRRAPAPIPVFSGRGLQPGVDLTDNAGLEDLLDADS